MLREFYETYKKEIDFGTHVVSEILLGLIFFGGLFYAPAILRIILP